MAMCWPKHRVALDVRDAPNRKPLDDEAGWTVVRVSSAQLEDYESCRRIMSCIGALIGSNAPRQPQWNEQTHRLSEACLAQSA